MTESLFMNKVTAACAKKEALFDDSKGKYALRSMLAGALLTMSTAGGAYAAVKISHVHPDLSKFFFAFLFAFGLVYVVFLNTELATSNMMYLTAGAFYKKLSVKKAATILLYCTVFNLIGAMLMGWAFSQSGAFAHINLNDYIVNTVTSKLARSNQAIILEGVLANIFVNVAIVAYLFLDNQVAKITIILSAVFLFVYLGNEHVVANFASFSIVKFHAINSQIAAFDWFNILRQWAFAFIGNYIGGGILIGVTYAWLNTTKTPYVD